MIARRASVDQEQLRFVVGEGAAFKAVGEMIEPHANPLLKGGVVFLWQRLEGEPLGVESEGFVS